MHVCYLTVKAGIIEVCMYVCLHVCMHVRYLDGRVRHHSGMYTCMHACTYVIDVRSFFRQRRRIQACIRACMYVCTCMHGHTCDLMDFMEKQK